MLSDMCKIKKNTNKFCISPLVITATSAGSAHSRFLWALAQPSHCLHHKDFNVSQRQSNCRSCFQLPMGDIVILFVPALKALTPVFLKSDIGTGSTH